MWPRIAAFFLAFLLAAPVPAQRQVASPQGGNRSGGVTLEGQVAGCLGHEMFYTLATEMFVFALAPDAPIYKEWQKFRELDNLSQGTPNYGAMAEESRLRFIAAVRRIKADYKAKSDEHGRYLIEGLPTGAEYLVVAIYRSEDEGDVTISATTGKLTDSTKHLNLLDGMNRIDECHR